MRQSLFTPLLATLVLGGSLMAVNLAAQDEPSVVDAARNARQQKQASAKPAPVITNDTLAPAPTPASAPAPAATAASSAEASAGSAANSSAESTEKKPSADADEDPEQKNQEIAELKQQIADKQAEIKLLQRDLGLKQDTFYSNPDYQHDLAGKSKLDSMRTDIKQMKDHLTALQGKLADLGPQQETKPAPSEPQP